MRNAIAHLKQCDPVLARLIEEIGPCRIRYLKPDYQALAKAVVYQQLSGKVASVIFGRLTAAAGDGWLAPETLLRLSTPKLRAVGLSRQKIAYLRDLARRTLSGELDFGVLARSPDEEVMRRLTRINGIGPWTVHMFLIFAMRRKDVLPSGDLGIRAAVKKAYGLEALPAPRQVEEMAERWRPYASIASWYLWRSLETDANL